jgi:hypothetical protein
MNNDTSKETADQITKTTPLNEVKVAVKKKYPFAKIERDGALFFIFTGNGRSKRDHGAGYSEEGAWRSALIKISKTKH